MLILVLINAQYLQNVVCKFENHSSNQNHSLSDSHHPVAPPKSPQANFPSPLPLTTTWKTLDKGLSLLKFVCLLQVKFNFSIDNIFFRVVS